MSPDTPPPLDRRAALKARHREAILAAAHALVMERGRDSFGVDDLAERADVARRTVFNHFASLEDVLVTACLEELSGAVDALRTGISSTGTGGDAICAFEALAHALITTDILTPLQFIWRAVGEFTGNNSRPDRLAVVLFRVEDDLATELVAQFPGVDAVAIRVMVGSLVQGLATAAILWSEQAGNGVTEASRRTWDDLYDRIIDLIRAGYSQSAS